MKHIIHILALSAALTACDGDDELDQAMVICERHHPTMMVQRPIITGPAGGWDMDQGDTGGWEINRDTYEPGWEMCSIVDQRWHERRREADKVAQAAMDRQHAEERSLVVNAAEHLAHTTLIHRQQEVEKK